jgi:hypothetical protein
MGLSNIRGDLNGLKMLLSQDYAINNQVEAIKKNIKDLGQQRRIERMQTLKEGEKLKRTIQIPLRVTSGAQLSELIQQLQALRDEVSTHPDIEIALEFKDK